MYQLEDIIVAAKECKEALIHIKTIEDVINLPKSGVNERVNSIDIGDGFDEYDIEMLSPETTVIGVHLDAYIASNKVIIEDPIIVFDDGAQFHFDIWEPKKKEIESYEAFCDVTLDTVETEYNKYMAKNECRDIVS